MKGFTRPDPGFALCGLVCALCPMHHMERSCPGCGGGEGNQSCAIARCAVERNVGAFCVQCGQFPCGRYGKMVEYDSFVPHRQMFQDLERAEELGLEVYISQIEERRAILDQLLAGWNDGRRKSFYCLAVYLLELDDLRRAFEEIQAAAPGGNTVKEKVITAVGILKRTAESSGVALKLNKKPKER